MNIKQKLAVFGTGIAGVGIGSLGLTAAFASPGSSPAVGPAAAATSPAQVATTVAPVSPSAAVTPAPVDPAAPGVVDSAGTESAGTSRQRQLPRSLRKRPNPPKLVRSQIHLS